jgi:hypothetical protein
MTSFKVNDVSMYDFCALHGIVCTTCKQIIRAGAKNCLVYSLTQHETAHPDNHPQPNDMHSRKELVQKYFDFVDNLVSEMVVATARGDTKESVIIQYLGPLQLYRYCNHVKCNRLLIDPKNTHSLRQHWSNSRTFKFGYASRFEIKSTAATILPKSFALDNRNELEKYFPKMLVTAMIERFHIEMLSVENHGIDAVSGITESAKVVPDFGNEAASTSGTEMDIVGDIELVCNEMNDDNETSSTGIILKYNTMASPKSYSGCTYKKWRRQQLWRLSRKMKAIPKFWIANAYSEKVSFDMQEKHYDNYDKVHTGIIGDTGDTFTSEKYFKLWAYKKEAIPHKECLVWTKCPIRCPDCDNLYLHYPSLVYTKPSAIDSVSLFAKS